MAKIDVAAAPRSAGSDYPEPFDVPCRDRIRWALGDAAGLTQFGVNILHLPPGAWSGQRHWHSAEDEFVWILEVGSRRSQEDVVDYSDIDLRYSATAGDMHKDGTPYRTR
jgi:uncharacterized cupin superfamily protein